MGLRDVWNQMLGRPSEDRVLDFQTIYATGLPVDTIGTGVEASLRAVPLWASVRLIADQFASTPLHTYRERGGRKEQMPRDAPFLTPLTGTPATWKTQCIFSMLGRGNAYGYVTSFDATGWPSALVWLDPTMVDCNEDVIDPQWTYQGRDLDKSRLCHIPWVVPAGRVTGLSPVQLFRGTVEGGIAAQRLARDTFVNGGVPIGHFKNTGKVLTPESAAAMKVKFEEIVANRSTLVTGNDWEYNAIGLPPDQVAFIEGLKLSATQIATIFGVPAEEVGGETANSLTYSTVEMNELKLSSRTLRPWYVRVEEALSMLMPRGQYVKFNADALIRSDLLSRMQSEEIGLRIGVLTNDEARALEDRPPLSPRERSDWIGTYRQTTAPSPASTREIAP